jgi:hypothetical protein
MNPPKDNQFMQDDEYQLTFLLDAPFRQAVTGGSQVGTEVAEHVLHLPPAEERP